MDRDKIFLSEVFVHYDYFMNVARKMTQNQFDAEDLLQDTLIRAFKFIHSFQPGTNSKAWIYRIMKNLFINFNRKKQVHPCYSLDSMTVDPSAGEGQESLRYYEIMKLIEGIKDEYRQVIIMFHLKEFSLIEISKELKWPIGTVKSRLHRARNEFKKVLEDAI